MLKGLEGSIDKSKLLTMESIILTTLKYEMWIVCPAHWTPVFLKAAGLTKEQTGSGIHEYMMNVRASR